MPQELAADTSPSSSINVRYTELANRVIRGIACRQLAVNLTMHSAGATEPLLVRAARGEKVERAPCWYVPEASLFEHDVPVLKGSWLIRPNWHVSLCRMMRQAGRYQLVSTTEYAEWMLKVIAIVRTCK